MTPTGDLSVSKGTRVTLGLALTLITGLAAGFTYASNRLAEITAGVTDINYQLREMRTSIDRLESKTNGSVSLEVFRSWTKLLEATNEGIGLTVPDLYR